MSEQSNEAVQNIASVYADTSGTITVNNLTATGNLTVGGKIYSPTQKYYMQIGDDGNLSIYNNSGNLQSSIGTSGFINPTNPKLGFGGTGYYVALQSNGDMCVNSGKGANGNLACIGNSGVITTTGNVSTTGNISSANINLGGDKLSTPGCFAGSLCLNTKPFQYVQF